jgi:hypothetical protein
MKSTRKERLQKLIKAVGNDEIQQRIQQGNVNREMALAFIADRLRNMRQLQLREQRLVPRGAHWEWWRQVADNYKTWFTKPEPKRWHTAAKLYEDAAKALARGNISRGKEIMDRAVKEEQKQMSKLSDLVQTEDLAFDARPDVGWLEQIVDTEPGPCALPDDIRLAQEIQNVMDTVVDPMNRRRRRDPWWTLEDEEEEEEDGDGTG